MKPCLWCRRDFTPSNDKADFCRKHNCKRSYEKAVRQEASTLFDKHNEPVMAALRARHGDIG
jgi:hypothetical protein